MTTPQRLLVIVAMLAVAALLHLRICRWVVDVPFGSEQRLFHVTHRGETPIGWTYSGVVLRTGVLRRTDGVTYGLAVPVLLLGLAVHGALGWSRSPGAAPEGRRLRRARRVLLIATILVTAWTLHTNICEWVLRERYSMNPQGLLIEHPGPRYTGILLDRAPLVGGLIRGLCVPALLVVGSLYTVLEWRRRDRIRAGGCARCGYDLRGGSGTPLRVCPECGCDAGISAT